jgi:enoyl-[acyl-carrier protein] reductase II
MKNRVTEKLGIKYPVIMAAMGWVSDAKSVAAVSNAGGMGIIGPNSGQKTVDSDPGETAERTRHVIQDVRKITDKPFALNYLLPIPTIETTYTYADPLFNMMKEEKLEYVLTSGHEVDEREIDKLLNAGFKVIHRDICPTVESCAKASKLGVEAVIVTGYEAGGHMNTHKISLISLLPQVTDLVTDIPIIAAGGIVSAKGAAAAKAMGAEGVYVGTALMLAEESPVHDNCKQAIIDAKAEDLVEFLASIGHLRSTKTKMARRAYLYDRGGASEAEMGETYMGGFRIAMSLGDIDNGVVTVSEAVGALKEINPHSKSLKKLLRGLTITFE